MIMTVCAYYKCYSVKYTASNTTFFTLPSDKRRPIWLKHSRYVITNASSKKPRFCDKHFYNSQILVCGERSRLVSTAIPKTSVDCNCRENYEDEACTVLRDSHIGEKNKIISFPGSDIPKDPEKIINVSEYIRQFELIVEFMEQHPGLATNKLNGMYTKAKSNELWLQLKNILNRCGPPIHDTVDEWKMVWRRYKFSVRNKVIQNEKLRRHGIGLNNIKPLTDVEEQLISLLNFKPSCSRVAGKAFGIPEPSQSQTTTDEEIIPTPVLSSRENLSELSESGQIIPSTSRSNRKRTIEFISLLEMQMDSKQQYLNENQDIMKEICIELKLMRECMEKMAQMKEEQHKWKLHLMKLDRNIKTKKLKLLELQAAQH